MLQVASLIVLLVVGTIGSADARTIRKIKIHNWSVSAHASDSSGKFTHCASAAKYKSGITLLFSVSRTIRWAIGFANPEWELTRGNTYKVAYKIDDGPVHTGTGKAVSTLLVRMPLPDSRNRFNEFRYGDLLAVTTGKKVVKFKLTDTSKMLTTLLKCAKHYRDKEKRKDLF
jgi:hypothetical protein